MVRLAQRVRGLSTESVRFLGQDLNMNRNEIIVPLAQAPLVVGLYPTFTASRATPLNLKGLEMVGRCPTSPWLPRSPGRRLREF